MEEKKSGFMNVIEEKVSPLAAKVAGEKHLMAIRDGLAQIIPLVIVGSVFILLQALPIPGYDKFMKGIFGASYIIKLGYAINGTFSLIALVSVFTIAYNLARNYNQNGMSAGLLSLAAFVVLIPLTKDGAVPLNLLGSQGLFVAIIVSLITAHIYRFMITHDLYIKLPDAVPPNVTQSFVALFPGFAVVMFFVIIRWLVEWAGWGSVFSIVTKVIGGPLQAVGTGFWGGFIAVLVIHLFWIFGIHGANVVGSVMAPIWLAAADQNRLAFQAGKPIPNIIAQPFFDSMLWLGGSGILLGLAILVTFFAKSTQFRELGKVGFVPTIFTINEPFMFGIPVVLNPSILIPYLLAPLVNYNIVYWTTYFGIMPRVTGVLLPWTMPPFINGYLATNGSWMAVLVQVVCLLVSMAIYYPFFKIMDNQNLKQEQEQALAEKAS